MRLRHLFLLLPALLGLAVFEIGRASLNSLGTEVKLPKISANVSFLQQKAAARGVKDVPVLVFLKERADLSGARALKTREKKGRFVYEALTEVALSSQAELRRMLDAQGVSYRSYYITNMIAIDHATPELLAEIAARADVAKISGNPSFRALQPPPLDDLTIKSDADANVATNIEYVKAIHVWDLHGYRGQGIVIGGQDTGVEVSHPALKRQYRGLQKDGRMIHDFSWHDSITRPVFSGGVRSRCGYGLKAPCDDDEHGTHTMGTMVGWDHRRNLIGMAPDAKWIACRNMDSGNGTPAAYIECFQFFLAPHGPTADPFREGRPDLAPHVINNSWGCPADEGCEGTEFVSVVHALQAAGIFVVVSAGNDGPSCASVTSQPATISDSTFTVGAYDHRREKMASFSSRGPSTLDQGMGPDVVAPGVSIRSSIPGGLYSSIRRSGTSMAAPHVAGLVALIWSAQPKLVGQVEETAKLIRRTARHFVTSQNCGGQSGRSVPNNTFGYGVIDADHAVTTAIQEY